MSDGPLLALRAALVATLKADAGVVALVGARVYDEPPEPVTRPYIRISDMVQLPLRATGVDAAATITFGVTAHSRPAQGSVEATRIAQAVREALDLQETSVSPVGYSVVYLEYVTEASDRDTDGRSYTATVAFDTLLDV